MPSILTTSSTRRCSCWPNIQDVREYYQNQFRYLLVDEYQDTSVAQFRLVQPARRPEHQNICVVGDDDQSIYRFRGATIENILNFEQHLPRHQGHPAGAELPLYLQYPERGQLRHPAQHRAQGQDPVDRERRGRQGAGLHRRERAGRGQPHRGGHRPAPEGRAAIWPTTPSSTA